MLKNTLSSYGLITKLFHWFIGIAIVGLLVIGFIMVSMLPSVDKWQLYSMHKAGCACFVFGIVKGFMALD
jgi:cytochrome b561